MYKRASVLAPIKRAVPLTCLLLLISCAPQSPIFPVLEAPAQLSSKGENTMAYLFLEKAMRDNDISMVTAASQTLLTNTQSALPLIEAGGWFLSNRHMDQAHVFLAQAVKLFPEDINLQLLYMEILLEAGQPAEAVALFRQFAQSRQDDPIVQLELALLYLKADMPHESLAVFKSIPTAAQNPTVLYYHSQAALATGNIDAAAKLLRKAIDLSPDFLEAIYELALLEMQQKNYEESKKLFTELLRFDETNQDILMRLMQIAVLRGNPQEAYDIALTQQDSLVFILSAATMFLDQGRYDLAESLINLVGEDAPEDMLFYKAALAYEGRKDFVTSLSLLGQIPSNHKFYEQALRLSAQIAFEQGNYEDTLDVADRALLDFPEDKDFHYLRLESLFNLNRLPEGLKQAQTMRKLWPDDMDIAYQYGFFLDMTGEKKQAQEVMEEILLSDPDYPSALNYVGYTLADENRDLERALSLIQRAITLAPEAGYIHDSLAWVQYRLGQYPEAWQSIQAAIELTRRNTGINQEEATIYEHAGDIATALGNKAEAKKAYTRALELNPENPQELQKKLTR